MRILVSVVLIVLGLAGDALAQSCASTQGQLEYCKALTNAVRFGLPRYTTVLLPTCNTNNKGAIVYDTTANLVKYCTGSAWTTVGAGGGVSGLTTGTIPMAASATSLADSLLSQSGGNVTLASGQLLLPAGTAALPAWAFAADPDTGMYNVVANSLGFGTNGSVHWSINSGGTFSPASSGTKQFGTTSARIASGYWGGATLTASTPAIDIAQTWNNAGVTFTGFLMNNTDTASASGSLLMDLQVGGVSKFSVTKTGQLGTVVAANLESLSNLGLGGTSNLRWAGTAKMGGIAGGVKLMNDGETANAALYQSRFIEVVTTTKSPSALENGEIYTNTGDADGSAITLLNDPTIGSQYCVAVDAAQTVTVAPSAGESILQNGTAYTTSCTNGTRGSTACFVAITGGSGALWAFANVVGTWPCS